MQFVLYTPMPWPEQFMVVIMLLVGVIVAAVILAQLRRSRATG